MKQLLAAIIVTLFFMILFSYRSNGQTDSNEHHLRLVIRDAVQSPMFVYHAKPLWTFPEGKEKCKKWEVTWEMGFNGSYMKAYFGVKGDSSNYYIENYPYVLPKVIYTSRMGWFWDGGLLYQIRRIEKMPDDEGRYHSYTPLKHD